MAKMVIHLEDKEDGSVDLRVFCDPLIEQETILSPAQHAGVDMLAAVHKNAAPMGKQHELVEDVEGRN